MNKEIIEKLKKNEKPYGLLTREEREVLKGIDSDKIELFGCDRWLCLSEQKNQELWSNSTYRIKSDYYTEEPIEYIWFQSTPQ